MGDDSNIYPYTAGGAAAGLSFRQLLDLLREDYEVHDRNWSLPGLHALLVQRVGAWRLGLRDGLPRKSVSLAYRALQVVVRNVYGIEIYDRTCLGRRVRIGHQGGIVIDPDATVGDGCLIRNNVTIGLTNSGGTGAPQIGRNVELSPGAVLIGPITVGDDARIGPNAVVVTDVPAGSTAFATPARRMPRAGKPAPSDTDIAAR